MQLHQQRVVDEHKELAMKTEKLGEFLYGTLFGSLHQAEQARLLRQYAYMKMYLEILQERINCF
jgi:hypothetical protein